MTKWLVIPAAALALCGCSSSQQIWTMQASPTQGRRVAWDGLGRSRDPNLYVIKQARSKPEKPKSANENREAELAGLREYSREWVALRNAIDAEEDARLAKILIICRGCEDLESKTRQIKQSSSLTPRQQAAER